MSEFKIDFFEFCFLVEACIPPRPIARAMFWNRVIDEEFYKMTPNERDRLYVWLNRNDRYKEAVEKNEDAKIFDLRFDRSNNYIIETNFNGKKEKYEAFKMKNRYYIKSNTWIEKEFIKSVKELDE